MQYAPICLFTFNRLHHTILTIDALARNINSDKTRLIIFSDAAKNHSDKEKVQQVRSYLREVKGFESVEIVENDKNLGLAKSIIDGVSQTVEKYGRVIVLEDDMLTSPYFLNYMNQSLHLYDSDNEVISIHGYVYPVNEVLPETFFLKGADCWGWATWKDSWELFEPDGKKLYSELKTRNLLKEFNYNNSYSYSGMLQDQINNKNNSWAIRWYASAFLQNKLTLYPGESFVRNIGADNSGIHCVESDEFDVTLRLEDIKLEKIEIKKNKNAYEAFIKYFENNKNLFSKSERVITKLKKILKMKLPTKILQKLRENKAPWKGDYATWEQAEDASGKYEEEQIISQVEEATQKVIDGDYPYERDSVLFEQVEYSWPILAWFLRIHNLKNCLSVLDFGGALGSTYNQNRAFLKGKSNISWNIVEQKKFVEIGKEKFQTEELNFYFTIEECLLNKKIDVFLLSSVLQYIKDPYDLIDKIISQKIEYIVLDRLSIIDLERDLITVQTVPTEIYQAKYPCRFFNESLILKPILSHYEIIDKFESYILNETFVDGKYRSVDMGFVLRRKKTD